jgi:predicted Zn-ribbon and HTH transcriptional regulator
MIPAKPKQPFIPVEKHDTLRHEIMALLEVRNLSARDISAEVHISEKDVYDHLEHIRTALQKSGRLLLVTPPLCRKCGFEFRKRERLKKPGKCPVCSGEQIESPLFSIPSGERHIQR